VAIVIDNVVVPRAVTFFLVQGSMVLITPGNDVVLALTCAIPISTQINATTKIVVILPVMLLMMHLPHNLWCPTNSNSNIHAHFTPS
jgi:hypothetical protein